MRLQKQKKNVNNQSTEIFSGTVVLTTRSNIIVDQLITKIHGAPETFDKTLLSLANFQSAFYVLRLHFPVANNYGCICNRTPYTFANLFQIELFGSFLSLRSLLVLALPLTSLASFSQTLF